MAAFVKLPSGSWRAVVRRKLPDPGGGEITALREREQVSRPVSARCLNVRRDAVSKWERGEKRPNGPSLKLLNLVKQKGLQAIA